MRRSNGTGCVYKLSGNRRRPWAVRITVGWNEKGKQLYDIIGYYETKLAAKVALKDFLDSGKVQDIPKKESNPDSLRVYRIWYGMIARCYDSDNGAYIYYGGKGVKVCDEWKNNFELFYKWAINHGYSHSLTIDRINPYGNYEPENCRWIPLSEQARNTRKAWDKAHQNEGAAE